MHTGRAPRPLLENSLASASFVSDIMKKKFVDGVPVYRQEADLKRKGIHEADHVKLGDTVQRKVSAGGI